MKKLGNLMASIGICIGIIIMFTILVLPKIKMNISDHASDTLQLSDFTIFILNMGDDFRAHLILASCTGLAFIVFGTVLIRRGGFDRISK
jgi:type II secretory pathway component PulF